MTILDGFLMLASMLMILAMVRWRSRDLARLEIAAEQLHHSILEVEAEIVRAKLRLDGLERAIGETISRVKPNDRDFPLVREPNSHDR